MLAILGYTTGRALALVTESPALRIATSPCRAIATSTPADVLSRVRTLDGQQHRPRRSRGGAPPPARLAVDRRGRRCAGSCRRRSRSRSTERAAGGAGALGRGGLQLDRRGRHACSAGRRAHAGFDLPIADGLTPVPGRSLSGPRRRRHPGPRRSRARRPDRTLRRVAAPEDGLLALVSEVDVTDVEDAVVLLGRRSGPRPPRPRGLRAPRARLSRPRADAAAARRRHRFGGRALRRGASSSARARPPGGAPDSRSQDRKGTGNGEQRGTLRRRARRRHVQGGRDRRRGARRRVARHHRRRHWPIRAASGAASSSTSRPRSSRSRRRSRRPS